MTSPISTRGPGQPAAKDRDIEAIYPLSPMQQGMLFHTLYSWESGVYFRQSSWTLRKGLEASCLKQAWREVMRRHPILRTGFLWELAKEPLQVVHREVAFPWIDLDWRPLAGGEQQQELARFLEEDRARPFDLARAPLMRLILIRLGESSYRFIWSYPQLLLDGWSRSLVLREVLALHEGFSRGEALQPPASPPFRTYISWLRRQDVHSAELFWRDKLRGFSSPTTVGIGRDILPGQEANPRYGERARSISREGTEALTAMSRRHRLTLNTVVQTAWALLLGRYSNEEDVVYGLTLSGRPAELAGIESMVGLFINTLPMCLRLDPAESALELMRRVQTQQLELGLYEWTSLLQVQEWSEVVRGEPLFETIFVFENYPIIEPPGKRGAAGALDLEVNHSFEKTNFPLTVVAAPGDRLFLHIAYDDVRFEAPTIQRLIDHLGGLIEAITEDAARPIRELPLLGGVERHQLLHEWSGLRIADAGDPLAHRLFEQQVERAPDATAVEAEDGRLTYDQLNRRANRLARLLGEQGARADSPVALLAERGSELLTAVLAAFKAGTPYLPLAPRQPVHRNLQILQRSGTPLVLVAREHAPALVAAAADLPAADRRPRILILEELLAAERSEENLPWTCSPGDLAYVIYTSGSTGLPKGVMVEHRGMLNHLRAKLLDLELSCRDVVAQTASQTFDISVWQFLAALLVGGEVRVFGEQATHDPRLLLDGIEEAGITIFESVPGLLRLIVQEVQQRGSACPALAALRWVLATGEELPPDLCRDWLALFPGVPLLNAYGPTECSDDVTHFPIGTATALGTRRVPIGRPVRNLELYVVGPRLRLMPVGVLGELCVGGVAVGRGYLNDPGLTAELFVPDPFSGRPGARLYRTGDLVRVLDDGVIEFRRRLDHQIKIRGFRVEVGEIEAVLREHPLVDDAAVVVKSEGADRRLLAFVVPAKPPSVDSQTAPGSEVDAGRLVPAIRAFLKGRLPDYMVPASIALLEALPLNQSGKVNRRFLAEVEWELPKVEYEAPQTPVQDILAGIWGEVLNTEGISLNDNFFEIGGNSLLAIQVVSRIRNAFKVEVALRKLFEAATIEELSATVETAMKDGRGVELPPIRPVPHDGDVPLSFAQQRLWFLYQMAPASPVYNIPTAARLKSPIDPAGVKRSLEAVVQRHEVLRTTFETVDGEPFQRISPAAPLSLPLIDLTGLGAAEREEVAGQIASIYTIQPFDLQRGPLLRAALVRLAAEDHILLAIAHHIVSDAWSVAILLREMTALYDTYVTGKAVTPLPELPIQYADFALWQRQWLQGETLESELSFWRERLSSAAPVLELPTDRPRPAIQSYHGARLPFPLSTAVSQGLKALARREGATLFMLLMSGFQALLFRYTKQQDISVGTPIAGRHRQETENLIGVFVNTLVIRGQLSPDLRFREFLSRTRETALAVYAHPDMPFEKLVEELQPQRSLRHNPLFQAMLIMQNMTWGAKPTGLQMSRFEVVTGSARFDLLLALFDEVTEDLFGALEYSVDLFDRTTAQRLLGHLGVLLEGVVADANRPLSDLPLLAETERWQVAGEWNDTAVEIPAGCVHDLISAQAARIPESPALVFQGQALTYAELDHRSSQLARYLRSAGVGRGDLVGLLVERSVEMVVGLLGVLKAGAAYVPLDPEYPRERLSFIISDAGLRLLLTQERLAPMLSPPPAEVLRLDADWLAVSRHSGASLPATAGPADRAYLIYTSGSTGRPKGVEVTHGALVNFLFSMRERPGLTAADRLVAVTSLSFDIAGLELYLPLLVGARVVLASHREVVDGEALAALLASSGATVLQATPATWRLLLAVGWPGAPGLVALCGGESLPADLAAEIRQRCAGLWNLYGPTETTIWSAIHEVREVGHGSTPVGRPIANTQLYLLDPAALQAVPLGVAGELCIGGSGVARGYLGRPHLTAERFVPDPISGERGARLYRTGDLARALPSGALQFLGRMDHQVKIRGFRIELGEIEAELRTHPAVQEAVVVAQEQIGERCLVAYVVPREGVVVADQLRGFLRERVPGFMVPAAFVALERLPLTPNGKLDRRALPALEQVRDQREKAFLEAATPVEEVLAGIWGEVLGRDRIGRHDNFFELGGHSLLVTRVASRVRRVLGVELPLRQLFEQRTVADLAKSIESYGRKGSGRSLPRIGLADRSAEIPLSFSQERLWFAHQLEPTSPAYNIRRPVRLTGALDLTALARALDELVRRHEVLRTLFPSREGRAHQVILSPQPVALPILDLTDLAERSREEAWRIVLLETRLPFDLSRGPLLRARLIRLRETDHILLLTLHHIVTDEWSMNVLVSEVGTLYNAFAAQGESPLAELPIQYADFASWQRRWFSDEALEKELAYWLARLSGAPDELKLRLDHPRPAQASQQGANHLFALGEDLSRSIENLCRREGVTLFMMLLAIFDVLLYRHTGQEDLVVGTNVANRNWLETEGLIGFFVNDLALRADLSGNPTFTQLLARIRNMTLDAYAHQELPFEKLVKASRVSGSSRHRPLFQLMFVVQNTAGTAAPVKIHDLEVRSMEIPAETAKFDLSLFMGKNGHGVVGNWVFRTDLFEPGTIQRLAQGFKAVAEQAVAHPECRLEDLGLAPEGERADRDRQRREKQAQRLLTFKSVGDRAGIAVIDSGPEE